MSQINIPHNLQHTTGHKPVNGIPHFYRTIGSGEPFVFLHGGPGMWHDELVPSFLAFAENHQCIFYDQRGNGQSTMAAIDETNFTTALLVDDLEALRQAFGLEKLNLIGHSWGGLLAMYYAARYPQNVNMMVLVSPAPVNTALLVQSYEKMIGRFSGDDWDRLQAIYDSEAYLAGDPEVHNEAMRLSEGVTFYNAEAREEYFRTAVFDEEKARNMVAISGPAHQMKMKNTIQDQLHRITCPTLIVQGEEDFIVPEAAELVHQLIRDSKLVFLPGCGHYPFMEARVAFFEALQAFIAPA